MDLVNDLSTDVALAVLVEGTLRQKLGAQDAKSFIAAVEAELARISAEGDEGTTTSHPQRSFLTEGKPVRWSSRFLRASG